MNSLLLFLVFITNCVTLIMSDSCPGDEFCVDKSDGYYEIESSGYDGDHYMICDDGIAYCVSCPVNTTFNQESNECESVSSNGYTTTLGVSLMLCTYVRPPCEPGR